MPAHLFAPISASASGATAVVTGVPGKRIVVTRYFLAASGAVSVSFLDGTTAVTGAMPLAANGNGLVDEVEDDRNRDGLFATSVGNTLSVNLSGAVAVGGYLSYRLEQSVSYPNVGG